MYDFIIPNNESLKEIDRCFDICLDKKNTHKLGKNSSSFVDYLTCSRNILMFKMTMMMVTRSGMSTHHTSIYFLYY